MSEQSASCSSGQSIIYIKRRHGTIILRAGHQYNLKRKNKSDVETWECTQRKKKCKGFIKIKDNNIVHEFNHTCAADFKKNENEERLYQVKQALINKKFPAVPQTFNSLIASCENTEETLCDLPKYSSVKSSLYRFRNKVAGVDRLQCKEVDQVQIPLDYQDFVLADYSENGVRVIVFCSERAKLTLTEIVDYYSDGTFKSCPIPFIQLYTIHGDLGSTVNSTNIVPLVYALMSSRTEQSYFILFSLIKSQIPEWNPRTYKTDYEKAAMNAIRSVFPTVIVRGCYYHYNKAIWGKGKELGITKSHNSIKIREVALSAVLPLLPATEIMKGWTYITRKPCEDENMKKFRTYMEKQWLREGFMDVWCVYGQQHRTTNYLEGWHNKLNHEVGTKHPNLMGLLHVLRNDSSYSSICTSRVKQKNPLKQRKAKQIFRDQFIQEIQLELVQGDMTVGHFLETIRH